MKTKNYALTAAAKQLKNDLLDCQSCGQEVCCECVEVNSGAWKFVPHAMIMSEYWSKEDAAKLQELQKKREAFVDKIASMLTSICYDSAQRQAIAYKLSEHAKEFRDVLAPFDDRLKD